MSELCADQGACPVCQLWPLAGEPDAAWLKRVGDLFRAASEPIATCHRGHPLEGDNVYLNPTNRSRICRQCRRDHGRARRARRRLEAVA